VPVPDETAGRLAALIGLMAFFTAACVLLARPRERGLSLPAARGTILVPRRATRRLAGEAFSGHPDVVATRPRVTVREGRLSIEARILLRPGADVARLGPAISSAAAAEVTRLTGFAPEVGRVRFKILRVRQLARYL
jgi:hypothetical protein